MTRPGTCPRELRERVNRRAREQRFVARFGARGVWLHLRRAQATTWPVHDRAADDDERLAGRAARQACAHHTQLVLDILEHAIRSRRQAGYT